MEILDSIVEPTSILLTLHNANRLHLNLTVPVRVLKNGPSGLASRLPKLGPYLSDAEIGVITEWIDDGCLS